MWETGLRPLPRNYQTFWFWASEAKATDASSPYTVLETVFNAVSKPIYFFALRKNDLFMTQKMTNF